MIQNSKINQLKGLLNSCSYQQIDKIRESCYNIFSNYQYLDPFHSIAYDGQYSRTLIELRGNVQISFQDKKYNIVTYILFPLNFPQVPPVIKLKNIDPQRFKVHPKFLSGCSPDGSMVQLFLNEAKSWTTHYNIIRIMQEMQKELSNNFPFYEPQNNPQGQNFYQQPPYYGQQPNPIPHVQDNFHKQDIFPKPSSGEDEIKVLNKNITNEVKQITEKMKQDLSNQTTTSQSLLELKSEMDQRENQYNDMEQQMKTKIKFIEDESDKLQTFIEQNDQLVLNETTIDTFLASPDNFSKQVLELVAENRAIIDSLMFLEKTFKKEQIDTDTLIKYTREFAAREFDNKVLLKKCFDCLEQK